MSHDGTRALSLIAFIGTEFSPWYAWSGRRDPANHVCLNVAMSGPGAKFCMTDRGRAALGQAPGHLTLGPSSLRWDGEALTIRVDEVAGLPRPGRLRGTVRLMPQAVTGVELPLTADGAHVWRPFAPAAAIEVDLDVPGWTWEGHGYFDGNFGTRAMEADFDHWTWARFATPGGGAMCVYDAALRGGGVRRASMRFGPGGDARHVEAPEAAPMGRTAWGLRRELRADPGTTPRALRSMLDAPFYARATVETTIGGERLSGVHEVIDLRRYANRAIRPMIAWRVPRRPGWRAAQASPGR